MRYPLGPGRCEERRERVVGRGERPVDVGDGVRRREKAGLELGGGEVEASVEHRVKKSSIEVRIGSLCRSEISDRALREEEADHRSRPGDRMRDPVAGEQRVEPLRETPRNLVELPVDARIREGAQGRDPGRHRKRVARKRPGLIDRALGRELGHDVGPSAEGADRADRPPMILPKVVRSGRMPSRSWAPPGATRKPVMTSSKIRIAPWRAVSSRKPARKPGAGNTSPMLPTYGSTMTAAISSGYAREGRLDAVEVVVVDDDRVARGPLRDPRRVGTPLVSAPLPAEIRNAVAVPVVAAGELDDACRVVKPRASRNALIVASVPLETKRTCSTDGTIATDQLGELRLGSVGAPYDVPRAAAVADRLDDRAGARGRGSADPTT